MPDFLAKSLADQERLGPAGADRLLEAGRQWDLTPALRSGGSAIFPHATIDVCGHQIAAVVHACLDSNADRIVALGVLHARSPELTAARARAVAGHDVVADPCRGIQGPDSPGRTDWREEFSLSHFQFLLRRECLRRHIREPELTMRYPFLAAGHPESLPGIDALGEACRNAAVVATMDAFHHGIGYGEPASASLSPEAGGLAMARTEIDAGMRLLHDADYMAYEQHCARTRSDGRDVGQVLRYLLGPMDAQLLDLLADDMAPVYQQPAPTWVAGALIVLRPAGGRA
jgi:hypothetical protein